MEPLRVCCYEIDCDDIADLRNSEICGGLSVEQADLACRWLLDVSEFRTPRSWKLASRLFSAGLAGIIVPSFAKAAKSDMANLVLWRWGADSPHRVEVNDPSGRLPHNMLSWPDE